MIRAQSVSHAVSIPATENQLVIEIPTFALSQHWAVVFEPDGSTNQPSVEPESVQGAVPGVPAHLGSEAIQPIPGGYQVSENTFRLQSLPGQNRSALLIVHAGPLEQISILQAGRNVFTGSLSAPVLIVDGKVYPKTDHAILRAGVLLMAPFSIADETGSDLRTDVESTPPQASTAGLRRHLVSLPPITVPLDGQPFPLANGNAALVVARIQINPEGAVTSVIIDQGDDPLESAVRHALQNAKFVPFIKDGKAIAVTGIVQYSLSGGGDFLDASIK
jgi:hypothetical protein